MSCLIANLSSGLPVYDASFINLPSLDTNAIIGSADLSLNATQMQYMMFNTNITTPATANGNGISFSGWFYPTGTQALGSTIFDISGTGGVSCALYYNSTSNTLGGYFNGATVNSLSSITPGQWHFFAYTILCLNNGNALQSLYVDNNPVVTSSSAIYTSFSTGGSFPGTFSYIGYGVGGSVSQSYPALTYFNGKIDDFRFYSRALSLPEVNVLYNFNYGAGITPDIKCQISYDVSYMNVVQIDVSGTFSGLYVTKTLASTGVSTTTNVSCANLQLINGTTWAYVDTNVSPDTTYKYSVTPYLQNSTAAFPVNLGSVTTTAISNGGFDKGSGLPKQGAIVAANTANLPGWTVLSSAAGSNVNLCNGTGITGVYSGVLPTSVSYYLNVNQILPNVSSTFQQYVGIYQGTSGVLSFYAWPQDGSYNALQTITVMLDCMTLLSNYSFSNAQTSGTPYTTFNLPFSLSSTGTCLLTITVSSGSISAATGICIGGLQISSQTAPGSGYKAVDPSALVLYYPFDSNTVIKSAVYNCAKGGVAMISDASLCGGAAISATSPAPLMGSGLVNFNGSTSYVTTGSWSIPPSAAGNGFSICGWVYPQTATALNSLVCWFTGGTGGLSSDIKIFLNNGALDFSMNYVDVLSTTTSPSSYTYTLNAWNFFSVTGLCGSDLSGTYTFYLNANPLTIVRAPWTNPSTSNGLSKTGYLGGYPSGTPGSSALGYLSGAVDDFRVYNRALSGQDIYSLWSYGFATSEFANLIDPVAMGLYYPMDQITRFVASGYVNAPTFINTSQTGTTLVCTGNFFGCYVTYTNGTVNTSPASGFYLKGNNYATQVLTGMTPNTSYVFTVYLMNGSTVMYAYSTSATFVTSGAVNTPAISNIASTSLTIGCTGTFTGCNIKYSGGYAAQSSPLTIVGTNTITQNYTALVPNTQYTFTVYPNNSNNVQSSVGSTVSAVTLGSINTPLSVSNTTSTGTTLSCTGLFSSCNIVYSGGPADLTSPLSVTATNNTATQVFSGMNPNTSYTFTVYPVNSAGSATATGATTTLVTLGSIDATPTISDLSATSLTLSCTGAFSKCQLVYTGGSATQSSTLLVTGNGSVSQAYTGLAPNTSYTFLVYPVNSANVQSNTSAFVSTTTMGIANFLTFMNTTSSSTTLQIAGSFSSCYITYTGGFATPGSPYTASAVNNMVTQVFTGMAANTSYTFTVYPINSQGVRSTVGVCGTVTTASV